MLISSFILAAIFKMSAQNQVVKTNDFSITKLDYYAGTTTIQLKNNTTKALALSLDMEVYATETEPKVEFNQTILLDQTQKTITINDIYYCKAIFKVEDSSGNNHISKEINDGEWLIHNPEHLFFQDVYIENRTPSINTKLIERSLIVVPRLYNKVYVTKHVKTDINDLQQLEFYSERLDELKITLEYKSGDYEYFLDNIEDGIQQVPLSLFENEYGENCPTNGLLKIHFELKGYELAMPIKLQHLEFNNMKTQMMTIDALNPKHNVYPNPTNGNLNIQMENPGKYRFELFNAQQQVYLKYIEVNGSTQISLPDFTPGAYFYRISNDDDEWVEQLIVR